MSAATNAPPKPTKRDNVSGLLSRALDAAQAKQMDLAPAHHDEPAFRYALNDDAMASDKLAEGIRLFAADAVKLEKLIEGLLK